MEIKKMTLEEAATIANQEIKRLGGYNISPAEHGHSQRYRRGTLNRTTSLAALSSLNPANFECLR